MERGLRQNNETGAEINELVGQLEANNPTEAPNEVSGVYSLLTEDYLADLQVALCVSCTCAFVNLIFMQTDRVRSAMDRLQSY